MSNADSLAKVIQRLHDLPAMPCIVQQVLETAGDPSADVGRIAALIECDPALTARILRISNAAYYGMRHHVGTMRLALVILGLREVRNLLVGVAVFDAACGGQARGSHVEALWRHSTGVGAFAKMLGARLEFCHHGEDFIAGLLHDIGKAVMLRHFGNAYAGIVEQSKRSAQVLTRLEEAEFGFDHAAAAAAAAAKWNLPATLADAVSCHHNHEDRPFASAKDPTLPALVWVADQCVDAAARGLKLTQAADDPAAWTILDQAPRPLAREARMGVLEAIAAELELASSVQVQYE